MTQRRLARGAKVSVDEGFAEGALCVLEWNCGTGIACVHWRSCCVFRAQQCASVVSRHGLCGPWSNWTSCRMDEHEVEGVPCRSVDDVCVQLTVGSVRAAWSVCNVCVVRGWKYGVVADQGERAAACGVWVGDELLVL